MQLCCQKESKLTSERGGVTILSLLTVFTAFLLSSSYLYLAQADLRMTTRQIQSRQAVYLADAGIEQTKYQLAADSTWCPQGEYRLSTGSYTLTVTKSGSEYVVESIGKAGEAVKKVRATLQPYGEGELTMISYMEVVN
jgi:hypothetical protein